MIDKKSLWALAEETMRAYMPSYQMAMRQAIEGSGVPDRWFGLSLARGSDPAPFTTRRYRAMFPYAAQQQFVEMLDNLAQLELLERVEEGAYRLTDGGRKAAEGIFEAAHRCLETVEPLPAGEMDHLNALLYRIVKATLEAPEPAEKWAITYSRWTDPGKKAPASVKTDQYLTDLTRYRDDAHIAAWKPYGVSGHAWEALTFIWRDEAHTAGELAERLSFRAHSVEDYQEALQDLAARGWVVEDSGAYALTDEGKRIREEAEEATDRHFYVGWSALSQDELGQLHDLLTRANDNLRATALSQVGDLARELGQAVPAAVRDGVTPIVEEVGLNQPGLFYILLSAQRFAPEPISAARLSVRSPYTSSQQFDDLLTAVAEAGFLAPKGNGEYTFTDQGRSALHQVNHAFYTQLGELSTLTADELTQAQGLLKKVADACLDAPEPADKPCISVVPNGLPDEEYAPLAQIDQCLDYLNAFRDDAHLAAWQPYGVSGHAWEAFTFVWRDEAHTAEELAEKLPRRGHSAPAYAEALSDLAGRGWVEETSDGGAYRITEKGRALRQQAEEATDRYFFAPWTSLNNVEIAQLHTLLTRLRDSLQTAAENNAQTA